MSPSQDTATQAAPSTMGVLPTTAQKQHILGRKLTLYELFVAGRTDTEYGDFLRLMRMITRVRIIGVFIDAIDDPDANSGVQRQFGPKGALDPRLKRSTDNYLYGAEGTVTDLVYFVGTNAKGKNFVREADLPPQYAKLTEQWRNMVLAEARRLLLVEALVGTSELELLDANLGVFGLYTEGDIWYHDNPAIWQTRQSVIDEYFVLRRQIAEIFAKRNGKTIAKSKRPQVKRDDRAFHGRSTNQGRRQARENGNPGASIGGVR